MDTNTLILVFGLLFLGVVILIAVVFSGKMEKIEKTEKVDNIPRGERSEKRHMEFSKVMMLIILSMWVLGGLVGFWVVIFQDFSLLKEVQTYVSYPVTAGIGFYSVKSGAENVKKIKGSGGMVDGLVNGFVDEEEME